MVGGQRLPGVPMARYRGSQGVDPPIDQPGKVLRHGRSDMEIRTVDGHEALVRSLLDPERWPQGGAHRARIDTHISTVVLAGDRAYKIKKPLNLGFLDFVSLASRKAACDEELRLNRRLAPQVYERVCAVTGSIAEPRMDGDGAPIDWAVCMRRFDPDAVLSNPRLTIDGVLIDRLADAVATFHTAAPPCPPGEIYGDPDTVWWPMHNNFGQLEEGGGDTAQRVMRIEDWTADAARRVRDLLLQRKRDGYVRECHGDLHLGNVALIDGRPVVFDAIEFNPAFRWIDTINDVAFLTMDLHHRGRSDLAYRFIDRYLALTGDYAALRLLRFYEVYRALVRAKIAAIRLHQLGAADGRDSVQAEVDSYVYLAERLAAPMRGAIVITCGVSGSGKSHHSAHLPGPLAAVRVRADVERKRLLGVDADRDVTAQGGYTAAMTARTYDRLAELARTIAGSGLVAVVDATFVDRTQRVRFRALADELGVPFLILDFEAPADMLRERIVRRRSKAGNVSDADIAVLERQLIARDPLDMSERSVSLSVLPDQADLADAVRRRLRC